MKSIWTTCLLALAALLSGSWGVPASASYPELIERLRDSVVGVVVNVEQSSDPVRPSAPAQDSTEDLLRLANAQFKGSFRGAGFLAGSGRHVVTAEHIFPSSFQSISVFLFNGTEVGAKLVASDARLNIAVLELSGAITVSGFQADAAQVPRQGESVLALGYDRTLGTIASTGTVHIALQGDVSRVGLIQSSAVVSPAMNGGPLVDDQGRLVGMIATMENARTPILPMSFAIPAKEVLAAYRDLTTDESKQRGKLDASISGSTAPDGTLAIRIESVAKGGAADNAGLRQGDLILAVDSSPVAIEQFMELIANSRPGKNLSLLVSRSGRTQSMRFTVGR